MLRTEETTFDNCHSRTNSWRQRDSLAAVLLFLATAAFVLRQNSRVAVLWDLGYLLDTSWRIALGQTPYRDFPLVHAPLTFLIQAGLMRAAGPHYLLAVAYAAVAGGLATLLAWRTVLRLLRASALFGSANWLAALLLTAPLAVLGIYSVYPHPIYDCDCGLAILLAILLLVRLGTQTDSGSHAAEALFAGAATVLPLFFKQNMGIPFLAAVGAGMFFLLAAKWVHAGSVRAIGRSQPALVLTGIVAALLIALALISATAGLGNYLHWTVQFAAQRRLPGLGSMLAVYSQPAFVWTLPTLAAGLILCHTALIARMWARATAFCLIAAPFAGSLIFLFIDDDADERADNLLALWPLLLLAAAGMALLELRRGITLTRLIPFFVLAAIHGTFLSQQLWGSTYALWPLLMVLVAGALAALPRPARSVAIAGSAAICATFVLCGTLYAASLERLRYIKIPETPLENSSIPALHGMAARGNFLSNFEELVEFTAREIPPNDALLLFPGEDPFYFATGRTPQFPVTLFDPTTDPYPAAEMLAEARRRQVRWVIIKRILQIKENPLPESRQTMELVAQDFAIYRRLRGYDVYRLR
jgi:hypothetical protein